MKTSPPPKLKLYKKGGGGGNEKDGKSKEKIISSYVLCHHMQLLTGTCAKYSLVWKSFPEN